MRSLSKDELRALLTVARAKRERDWLMILVAYTHALRATEVLSLQRCDLYDGYIVVQRLKGSEKTVQPLLENDDPLFSEKEALLDYALKSTPGQPIFKLTRQRFWQIVREHGTSAGIAEHKLFPHALKHTIGRELIENVPINKVQKYMGHRSMASTGKYMDVTDEEASSAVGNALKKH